MGEYAIRKSDNLEIKIGTCYNMYYLRMEDTNKVDYTGTYEKCAFRLPFPDEDHILPGEYQDYDRHVVLYGFECNDCAKDKGTLQLHNDYGLLLNVPCFHGEKLPENTGDIKSFFNGKAPHYALYRLEKRDNEVVALVGCRACGEKWAMPLKWVIPFVRDSDLKERLKSYNNED